MAQCKFGLLFSDYMDSEVDGVIELDSERQQKKQDSAAAPPSSQATGPFSFFP